MLTTEAFNALLKTLEEPPPQVVMILATTDIHRVPATIISRCQRFDFRRLTSDDVIGRLILICDEEEIECEPAVLELVARSAWGSLRDAENLLEQLAVSFGTGEITEQHARELLGIGDTSSALASLPRRPDTRHQTRPRDHRRGSRRGAELKGLRDSTISALRGALLANTHHLALRTTRRRTRTRIRGHARILARMLHAITILGHNERFGEASSPLSLEIAALRAIASPPEPATGGNTGNRTATAPTTRPRTSTTTEPTTRSTNNPTTRIRTRCDNRIPDPRRNRKAAGRPVRTAFAQANFIGPNDDGVLVLQPKYASATNASAICG